MRGLKALAFVLLLGGAAFAGWAWYGRPPAVALVAAQRGPVAQVVYATGVVEPIRWAKVIANQRKRIVDICQCEGETVKAGDVLARLDDTEARANLNELDARRALLKNDVERLGDLFSRGAASKIAFDQAQTALREMEARIAAVRQRLEDFTLRAPIDGVVLRRDGQIGDMAGIANADVLFWVGQPKPLRVNADVNEEDIARVAEGQKVLLRHEGFAGQALEATVSDITPRGDPQTKTFRVYLALPDDTRLRIGMSVEANIIVAEKPDAVLVPTEAIVDGAVFALEDGTLRRVPVKTGVRATRMTEIVSGLEAGRRVVSPARADLKDGARARAAP